jgi:simple sugar transport system permease protein
VSALLTPEFFTVFLATCIAGTLPLLLAAVGETIGERAGILNLGIDGMMLLGGYFGYVAALSSGSIWLGMLVGVIAGAIASLLIVVLSVMFGLSQIVLGLALGLAGGGLTTVLYDENYSDSSPRVSPDRWAIPGLSDLPIVGPSLFSRSGIFWVCIVIVIIAAWFLRRSNWGLSVRTAGQKPSALDAAGGSVMRTRAQAALVGGAFSGLGGAYLALLSTGTFTEHMTNGIGFIAIIVAMLSRGNIVLVAIISTLYGLTVAIGTALQLTSLGLPTDVITMLPAIVIMLVLLLFARGAYVPPALGVPYARGTR